MSLKRAAVVYHLFFILSCSELGLETSGLLYSFGVYSALRLEISGLSSACYSVVLFRAGVVYQRFVIFLWCVFSAEVRDQRYVISLLSSEFIQS